MRDALIMGGGPGGAAAALMLRALAPASQITLCDLPSPQRHRGGETLPAAAFNLFQQLGISNALQSNALFQSAGAKTSWGGGTILETDFIFSQRGPGWHLRRGDFDSLLLRECSARGIEVHHDLSLKNIQWTGSFWRAAPSPSAAPAIEAKTLIDATGPQASVSRQLQAHPVKFDKLISLFRLYQGADADKRRTLVEPQPLGWWYACGLPDGHLVAFMTDADIAAKYQLSRDSHWDGLLQSASLIRHIPSAASPITQVQVRPAHSSLWTGLPCLPVAAVGDAASTFDPLSSLGIFKALRSGIYAAYALANFLLQKTRDGFQKYHQIVQSDFQAYRSQHLAHYQREQRWPQEPFWKRRHQTTPN